MDVLSLYRPAANGRDQTVQLASKDLIDAQIICCPFVGAWVPCVCGGEMRHPIWIYSLEEGDWVLLSFSKVNTLAELVSRYMDHMPLATDRISEIGDLDFVSTEENAHVLSKLDKFQRQQSD